MNKRIPILFGIILVFIALWMIIAPPKFLSQGLEELENLGYDLQLRARLFTKTAHPTAPIAIIDIDDKSLEKEGRWPWQRRKLAELINELEKQGAAVIAFDMFFAEEEHNIADVVINELAKEKKTDSALISLLQKNASLFNYDAIFAKSIANSPSILAFSFLPNRQEQNLLPAPLLTLTKTQMEQLNIVLARGYISNIPILQSVAKGAGFINIFPDLDGILRHAPMLIQYAGGKVYPALSLEAVLYFLGEKIKLITPIYKDSQELEGIQVGGTIIPTDASGQVLIPFIGKSYTFPYFSATDVMHGNIPKDALLGKILFVGTSATGSGDLKATAIQNPFPGVEIQASLANGILMNNFSYKPEWTFGANIVITLFFGLLAAILFPYLGPRTLGIIIVVLPPVLFFLNNWIWVRTGLILLLLIPVILILILAIFNIIYGYLFETRRREHLKTMFGQYVPEKHIDEMLKTSSSYALHGEDREMSVLFADIRNFTSISEGMSAADLVEMLNTFFTPMTEIIFKHRGTIDKYVGDLIMAFWGAPLKDKNHARHAIAAALEMQAKVKDIQPILTERNWPEIKIGIGINSGVMSVGDMGSRFRRNYTVLGDAVNLASRIEGLTKYYGVNIIVTENTQQNQTRFIFRKLDKVTVKGKTEGISIYEVICKREEATPELNQELALYHQALEDYFKQHWEEAFTLMQQLSEAHPEKKIYRLYLERINEFKNHPLPPDWDGIYAHVSK